MQKRLRTASAREEYARQQIRDELLALVAADNARGLAACLERLLQEARAEENGRPRGHAQTRDDRGNTLLAVAAMRDAGKVAECVHARVYVLARIRSCAMACSLSLSLSLSARTRDDRAHAAV